MWRFGRDMRALDAREAAWTAPLVREPTEAAAVEVGACLRPLAVRRLDTDDIEDAPDAPPIDLP